MRISVAPRRPARREARATISASCGPSASRTRRSARIASLGSFNIASHLSAAKRCGVAVLLQQLGNDSRARTRFGSVMNRWPIRLRPCLTEHRRMMYSATAGTPRARFRAPPYPSDPRAVRLGDAAPTPRTTLSVAHAGRAIARRIAALAPRVGGAEEARSRGRRASSRLKAPRAARQVKSQLAAPAARQNRDRAAVRRRRRARRPHRVFARERMPEVDDRQPMRR